MTENELLLSMNNCTDFYIRVKSNIKNTFVYILLQYLLKRKIQKFLIDNEYVYIDRIMLEQLYKEEEFMFCWYDVNFPSNLKLLIDIYINRK